MSESENATQRDDRTLTPSAATGDGTQAQRQQVQIDDSKASSNFCRVTGTPEELIIDFGLNPQPFGVPTAPIPITQRIVTNSFTAKRLWHALSMMLQRHEATFGVLETDVQKRVNPLRNRVNQTENITAHRNIQPPSLVLIASS